MRWLNLLVLSLSLAACGANEKEKGAIDTESEDKAEGAEDDDTVEADGHSLPQFAQLISTIADLPECDETNSGILIYVKDDANFQACENGEWGVIDIKGKDGEDGKDGEPTPSNVWIDPITKRKWLIGGVGDYDPYVCGMTSEGWRLPEVFEIKAAKDHGIYSKVTSSDSEMTCALTKDAGLSVVTVVAMTATACPSVLSVSALGGIFCIQR